MTYYSERSIETLSLCHEDLITVFSVVGILYNCTVAESYRNKERQERLFLEGLTTAHYPHYHNSYPSFAVDVVPYETGKGTDWDMKQCLYFGGFVMGIAAFLLKEGLIRHEIYNGADWDSDHDVNDTVFMDPCHFFVKPIGKEKMNYVEKLNT